MLCLQHRAPKSLPAAESSLRKCCSGHTSHGHGHGLAVMVPVRGWFIVVVHTYAYQFVNFSVPVQPVCFLCLPQRMSNPAHKRRKLLGASGASDSANFAAQLASHLVAQTPGTVVSKRAEHQSTASKHGDGMNTSSSLPASKKMRIRPLATKSAPQLGPQHHKAKKLAIKNTPARTEDERIDADSMRAHMEEKARKYAALKRGDHVPGAGESLVDFDRKWAERRAEQETTGNYSDSDDEDDGPGPESTTNGDADGDDDDDDDKIVEWEDEFGRLRQGKRSDKEKMDRRIKRGELGAEELGRMSARPSAPRQLLHGDIIQTMAFTASDQEKMDELARKRDRSLTPPPPTHFDADREIRSKGVGFYKFSKDEDTRAEEMRVLGAQRDETELQRREREEANAAQQADAFLAKLLAEDD